MRKFVLGLVATIFAVSSLFAISTKDKDEYNCRITNEVLPYFNMDYPALYKENLKFFKGTSFGKQEMNIAYDIFGPEDAAYHIVVLHGLGETYAKYIELMYDLEVLTGNNIRFYVMDHRGYGFSDRFKIDENNPAHMDSFDNAIKDIKTFMDKVVNPDVMKTTGDKSPVYLFAHSMGGGISARFLEKHHGYFEKVILNSPMLSAKLMGLPATVCDDFMWALGKSYTLAGYGENYINACGVKKGPYNGSNKVIENDEGRCTNSPERYYFEYKTLLGSKENKGLYYDNAVGGSTYRWLLEAAKLCISTKWHILNTDKNAEICIFIAEDDHLINEDRIGIYGFCLQDHCKVVGFRKMVKGIKSRHELYMEVDEIRGDGETIPNTNKPVTVIDNIFKFYSLEVKKSQSRFI